MGKATTTAVTYEAEAIRHAREYAGDATRRVKELEARIAVLEAALKPFADHGEFIVKHFPDPETDQNHETATLVRHFRNAYNTLAGGKDE